MKKRRILLFLCIAAFTLCVLTQGTFAWFTDAVNVQKVYQIGDIKYIYSGSIVSTDETQIVVPGQPLFDESTMYLTNQSTIDTNFRVQIRYEYVDQTTHELIKGNYTNAADNQINTFMVIDLVPGWVYETLDECWHFKYLPEDTTEEAYRLPKAQDELGYTIQLINSIHFDGSKVNTDLSGALFKIQLIFQAKQAGFVDWQTLGMQEIIDLAGGS